MKHLEKYYIIKFAHNPNDPFGGRGYLPRPQGGPVLPGKPIPAQPPKVLPGKPINTPEQQVAAGILPGKPVPPSPAPQQGQPAPATSSNTTKPTSMFGTGVSRGFNPLKGLTFDHLPTDRAVSIDPSTFRQLYQTGMQR
tara:strand:+ start:532 stop:948 length:417 start_codon:yes stop_codon:yes gene_type:complete